MVWNSSVFNNCANEKLEFTGKWSLEYGNIIVNGANDLILQPTQIKICKNVTAFETSEGLAIVGEFEPFLKDFKLSKNNAQLIDDLLLASIDLNQYQVIDFLRYVDQQMCWTPETIQTMKEGFENRFYILHFYISFLIIKQSIFNSIFLYFYFSIF